MAEKTKSHDKAYVLVEATKLLTERPKKRKLKREIKALTKRRPLLPF